MEFLLDIFGNKILIVSMLSWFVAQLLKFIINSVVYKKVSLERLWGDGGMPSGHSATVSSLAAMCGWLYGFDGIVFGMSAIFAIVVMHDATGVRREAGKHATSIKEIADIINDMLAGETEQIRTEKLKEFVGHTPLQVLFGSLLGILTATLYCAFSALPYCSGTMLGI